MISVRRSHVIWVMAFGAIGCFFVWQQMERRAAIRRTVSRQLVPGVYLNHLPSDIRERVKTASPLSRPYYEAMGIRPRAGETVMGYSNFTANAWVVVTTSTLGLRIVAVKLYET